MAECGEVEELRVQNAFLREQVAVLMAEVEELKRRLGQSSRNSSKSPSSDPPMTCQQRRALARERAKKSLRKAGGQPGHEGKHRQMALPEQVDMKFDLLPGECSGCGRAFSGREQQQQQLCWAHAVRQLVEISERDGAPGKLGEKLLKNARQVIALHRTYLADGHTLAWLRTQLEPLRQRIRSLLGEALQLENGELTAQGEALDAFADTYTPKAPQVSSISPDNGPAAGGTSVTITGSGFLSGATAQFGEAAASEVVVGSPTSITATSPGGTGTVDVTVSDTGGTSATGSKDLFEYTGEPPVDTEVTEGPPSELEAPSISGVPRAGETLSGEAGQWGGTETEASFQWESCNEDGEECAEVQGAVSAEYPLAEGDVGSTLRLRVGVSTTDPDGSVSRSVATAQPVAGAAAPLAEEAPRVNGSPVEGQMLRATAGAWSAGSEALTYSYAWERCDEVGEACSEIEGADAVAYTLGEADVQGTLRVLVTAGDEKGSAGATSQPTATVSPVAPLSVAAPSVSGADQLGEQLEANPGIWIGEGQIGYVYQWQRCNEDGEACADVEGATEDVYTLEAGDVGSTLRAIVTASNTTGSIEASTPVSEAIAAPGPPVATGEEPSINGDTQVAQKVYAENGPSKKRCRANPSGKRNPTRAKRLKEKA